MGRQDTAVFQCKNLRVSVDGKEIVKGVDLSIHAGETHALMGPNGSGKSTLAAALMGHPAYEVTGEIWLEGQPVAELPPDERARRGMFLSFQYPVAVPGVTVASFLRAAVGARFGKELPVREFRDLLRGTMDRLGVSRDFASRYLNDGFSGGEKKRLEILQMELLAPRFALLDETDSGLDIDALKVVADGIKRASGSEVGVLLVTHYQRILNYVRPDRVHVFKDGRIVRTGGFELSQQLEERGYDWIVGAEASGGAAAGRS